LERVAKQLAGLGHLAAILNLVKVNDSFNRFLLAEKESLTERLALLITLEPPLEKPPRHDRRSRVAGGAPFAHLVSQMIDEIVHLFALNEQILEKRCLPSYNGRYTAFDIFSRGEESNGRAATILESRLASRQ